MLTREFVSARNCLVVHGDVSRRMICWKKTLTNSLVEGKVSENVRETFAVASKQTRTFKYGGKSKDIIRKRLIFVLFVNSWNL